MRLELYYLTITGTFSMNPNDMKILLSIKTREQIIDEFKNIKEGAYTSIIKVFIVVAVMFLINSYFTGPITPKMILIFVFGGIVIGLDIIFNLGDISKKINLLFELEKIQYLEEKESECKK